MKRSTWAAIAAVSSASLVDALGVALRSEAQGAGKALGFLTALGYELCLSLLLGLCLGALLAWLGERKTAGKRSASGASVATSSETHAAASDRFSELAPTERAPATDQASHPAGGVQARAFLVNPRVSAFDVATAALPLLACGAFGLYRLNLAFWATFHNRELASLLLVCTCLGYLGLALGLGNRLAFAVALLRERSRGAALGLFGAAVSLSLGVATWLIVDNRSGFAQLNRWLGFSLLGALVGYAVLRLALRRRLVLGPRWLGVAAWGSAAVLFLVGAFVPWGISARVAQSGGASAILLKGLRSLSDFDRDGYSALWSGGDCKGFDAAVHPGAIEVPGDGLDNNCFGGDASGAQAIKPPVWVEAPKSVPGKLNVLLITVETLRADAVGFNQMQGIAARHKTTPRLDAYAERSIVFDNYFATTPWTRLSLPAILSSRSPTRMHWRAQGASQHMRALEPDTPWIPQMFQRAGYRTVAILNSFRAFTKAESAGFDRGFDVYDTSTKLSYSGGTMRGHIGRAEAALAMTQLEQLKSRPFFLWIHLMEPHYLYQRSSRAPNFGDDPQDLYASEIWEVDAVVGEILDKLSALGLDDKTLVTVVGDHGEEFKEHGESWHGSNLMQTQIHTAALMHVPGLPAARIHTAVSHEDLGPTWLNLAGERAGFDQLQGRNLLPLVSGGRLPRDYFFLERYEVNNGRGYMAAIVHYPFKLIYTEEGKRFELYDLATDPNERSQAPREGAAYQTLESLLAAHVDGARR
ncbi:MAG: sulfatase-like hydrolase/transferase [Polyangiaceae bacterium]|nr:sulfatase-like hydrolase/transferase [Polyangiaceae bacterium]